MARTLHAVKPGEKAPPKKPKTVTQAAEGGTQRELLVAMRARVAKDVENPNTAARDLAALTRRLMEIDALVRAIDAADEGDHVGEAAATPDEALDPAAL